MKNFKIKLIYYIHELLAFTRFIYLFHFIQRKLGYKHVPILVYHAIDENDNNPINVSLEVFEKQINFISTRFNVIRLKDIEKNFVDENLSSDFPNIIITFDDAEKSILTKAHPVLEKYNTPYTIFVPSGSIGNEMHWMPVSRNQLSIEELRYLRKSPLVDFGSHSVNHINIRRLNRERILFELIESKRYLQEILEINSIEMFAYPYGGFEASSANTRNMLRQAKYKIAVTTKYSVMQSSKNFLNLRRIHFEENDDEKIMISKLNGLYDWLLIKEIIMFYGLKQFIK